jgi:hypothetical protein
MNAALKGIIADGGRSKPQENKTINLLATDFFQILAHSVFKM